MTASPPRPPRQCTGNTSNSTTTTDMRASSAASAYSAQPSDLTPTNAMAAQSALLAQLVHEPEHGGVGTTATAFADARERFAMYGKRNAHVSHYTPTEGKGTRGSPSRGRCRSRAVVAASERNRSKSRSLQATLEDVEHKQVSDCSAWTAATPVAAQKHEMRLKNPVVWQGNGELAAQRDDIEYHLDGILGRRPLGHGEETPWNAVASSAEGGVQWQDPCMGSRAMSGVTSDAEDGGYAMAQSVVALIELLRVDHVRAMLRRQTRDPPVHGRIRDVILLLRTVRRRDHGMLRLAIGVLALVLAQGSDADEFITTDVLDAIADCLAVEYAAEEEAASFHDDNYKNAVEQSPARTQQPSTSVTAKMFLKRKTTTESSLLPRATPSRLVASPDSRDEKDVATGTIPRDEQLRLRLQAFVCHRDDFVVDGRPVIVLVDVLGVVLHDALQIINEPIAPSHAMPTPVHQHQKHQRLDVAGNTLTATSFRKKQLIRNGGLETLVRALNTRVNRLEREFLSTLLAPVNVACLGVFQRVRTILRVLDQVSFLATTVQRCMTMHESVFRNTLTIVESLSEFVWGSNAQRKWKADPSFMYLIVDVLMSALRVLINLSHHNEAAVEQIARLHGTTSLFFAFCRLWNQVELIKHPIDLDEKPPANAESSTCGMDDKLVFDAYLLILSAITNCVEHSSVIRDSFSQLTLSHNLTLPGLSRFKSTSSCEVLISFFLSKVQSYTHLIELCENQRHNHGLDHLESESWIPEDVILGGCSSLLLGCLMKESPSNSGLILGALPDGSPKLLLRALSAFVALHSQVGALTPEVGKSVLEVERIFKSFLNTHTGGGNDVVAPTCNVWEHGKESTSFPTDSQPRSSPKRTGSSQPSMKGSADAEEFTVRNLVIARVTPEMMDHELHELGASTPPASSFKMRKFARVCSNVDDSEFESDLDRPQPSTPKNSTPKRTPPRRRTPPRGGALVPRIMKKSPGRVTTPLRRTGNCNERMPPGQAKGSPFRRLKRPRHLVASLEAEINQIDGDIGGEKEAEAVSSDRLDGDHLDFSQELGSTHDRDLFFLTSPKVQKKTKREIKSPQTPNAPAKVPVRRVEPSPTRTQKRKTKASPIRITTQDTARAAAVFDFPG